jgi:hypothetical protein
MRQTRRRQVVVATCNSSLTMRSRPKRAFLVVAAHSAAFCKWCVHHGLVGSIFAKETWQCDAHQGFLRNHPLQPCEKNDDTETT